VEAGGTPVANQVVMNLLSTLKKEHREVKRLFKLIEETPGKKARQRIFMNLKNSLDAHMIAEEDVFYSRLKNNKNSKVEILEAFEEHHMAKIISDEIANLSLDDEAWMAKVAVFREMIEHHVEEEESEIFKQARRRFDEKELEGLNLEFESRRDEFLDGKTSLKAA
jgi:hemerythrin-like domain-containing protein